MCSGNHESAGKRGSGKTRRGNRWLRTALVEAGGAAGRTKHTALGARYRRLRAHLGHGRAVLAVGRHVLEITYHLLAQPTTYRELGTDYFDRYRAERLKRRSLDQLRRLGYQVTLPTTSNSRLRIFSGQDRGSWHYSTCAPGRNRDAVWLELDQARHY